MSNELIMAILTVLLGAGGIVGFFKVKPEAALMAAQAQGEVIANLQAENTRLLERLAQQELLGTERERKHQAELDGLRARIRELETATYGNTDPT